MTHEQLQNFLDEEQAKIDRANELSAEWKKLWFGILNPRWWKIKRELHEVVKSFRIYKLKK